MRRGPARAGAMLFRTAVPTRQRGSRGDTAVPSRVMVQLVAVLVAVAAVSIAPQRAAVGAAVIGRSPAGSGWREPS